MDNSRYLEFIRKGAAAEQHGDQQKLLDTLRATFAEIDKGPQDEHTQKAFLLPEYISVADDLKEHHIADDASRELLHLYVDNCDSRDDFFITWMLDEAQQVMAKDALSLPAFSRSWRGVPALASRRCSAAHAAL